MRVYNFFFNSDSSRKIVSVSSYVCTSYLLTDAMVYRCRGRDRVVEQQYNTCFHTMLKISTGARSEAVISSNSKAAKAENSCAALEMLMSQQFERSSCVYVYYVSSLAYHSGLKMEKSYNK